MSDTRNSPAINVSTRSGKRRLILVATSAMVLLVCLTATFLTRGAMSNLPNRNQHSGLVDQQPWLTASSLANLAVSAEEKQCAREAERLADHEVDQAFAMALRQAAMETTVLSGPALDIQNKVKNLGLQVKEDQANVDGLIRQIAPKQGTAAQDSLGDNLDEAKAQLQLDTDEMNDASDDLARASGGDKLTRIQQELANREAAMQKYDSQANSAGEPAVTSVKHFGTLAARIGGWFDQRSRMASLQQAQSQTEEDIAALTAQHAILDAQSSAATAKIRNQTGEVAGVDAKSKLAGMAHAHDLAQVHSILEDRLDTEKQLSTVYAKWSAQVALQHRTVRHLALQSMAWIAALILVAVLVWWLVQALLDRAERNSTVDRRSLHTLRTVVSLAIQAITLVLVLLMIFGAPSQMPTILGLGAAGLTVVFQDFILAFFGWFVLMGPNGIRVGDWVEINGVGGEVVEVGLFRTSMLETGNWTDKGHPTGRRVRFMNSFAVTGQYFNFSTVGQWMWDEINVNLPASEGTYQTVEDIHKAVLDLTQKDVKLAEAEWKGADRQHALGQFSAAPSVNMRPAASGIDILVRYVTRAGDRFETRNKLNQAVIELLHKPPDLAPQEQQPAVSSH